MPSIANQDFKIYGLLKDTGEELVGLPGNVCGELYAALRRTVSPNRSAIREAALTDSFVFDQTASSVVRQIVAGIYYDTDEETFITVAPAHNSAAYYDALWAIQQAIYEGTSQIASSDLEFGIGDNGRLIDVGYGTHFVNEDGYTICGTSADGKLASLYIGEKDEDSTNRVVVRLESLLPLVGELPLGTTEIW